MITPDEIACKAERLYGRAVKAWLEAEPDFFPYRIPCDLSLPESHSELIRQVDMLRSQSKEMRGFGYSIVWEEKHKRLYGKNHFPTAILFETLDDLVKLIRKTTEFRMLTKCVERVRGTFPQLNGWILKNWRLLLQVECVVEDLLAVAQLMVNRPRPDCFVRELPLSISTKLVEQNRSLLADWFNVILPPEAIDFGCDPRDFEQRFGFRYAKQHLLVRFLDERFAKELGCPWSELSLPAVDIARFDISQARVFVVENKVNLLTLPQLSRGIALGGLGRGVTVLSEINWLTSQPLYYWGDIDVDGFEILASLRYRFPSMCSLFMDAETLELYRNLATVGNGRMACEPSGLNADELSAFRTCAGENLRLEQEHIPQPFINARLARLFQA